MKKTSTSTETRSSSSESTHSSSSSSQSQEKTFPEGDAHPQPSNSTPLTTPVNTPVAMGMDSEHQPAPPAFHFSEGQWDSKGEKGNSDSLLNSRKAQTDVETSLFSFSLSLGALCLWLICMDVCTSPKPSMQQERQPSPQYLSIYLSINQSIDRSSLAIAYPFLSLSFSHTDCINQGLDQEEVVTGVQNEKGCPSAAGPDRQWRDTFSLGIKSQLCPLHPPVFVDASRGFKGKVIVFTPWKLCIFLSKGKKKCSVLQRNLT